MKILVTGSKGFIGKNLVEFLRRMVEVEILHFNREDSEEVLESLIDEANFIFHFAGANRPQNSEEFYIVNKGLTQTIVNLIEKSGKRIPILFTSSVQVKNDNDYGRSKKEAEEIIKKYSKEHNINCFIYRLPNVFGKWSRPDYNSVIATWCYNITRNIKIRVDDEETILDLVYIGDVIHSFITHIYEKNNPILYYEIPIIYKKSLGEIKTLLYQFRESRKSLVVPNVATGFERILYATYLSFLPKDRFSYKLSGNEDERGTFYEILKTFSSGQIGISTTKPGVTRGNHYHNTKCEKFLVLKGRATIELRDIYSKEIVSYDVSDKNLEIVEMIPGYTHRITNTGDEEMVLLIWANENYDSKKADTNYVEV